MKKGLTTSYIAGITDFSHGESYRTLLRYFSQEYISAAIVYLGLTLIDAYFVSKLDTSFYATLGVTNTLIHFIIKMAEGLSIGVVVLTGQFNGAGKFQDVGRTLIDSFWVAIVCGITMAITLYFGAYGIYWLYGVPEEIMNVGMPFLRVRAIVLFFTFVYFAFLGFLRGIKNTRTPMKIFVVGACIYLFFDYALIFGHFGFPRMGFVGSAMASTIQYASMVIIAFSYLFFKSDTQRYSVSLFSVFKDRHYFKELFYLSWPVIADKAIFAAAYIWLGTRIAPMGKYILATFTVIKDMERFSILPAVAFAQVITFLVSNDMGSQNWDGIKANIKKTIFLASIMVFFILLLFSLKPTFFVQFFDHKGEFTHLVVRIFPFLSVLIYFDLLQLILSGALRGAANVKVVMTTRLMVFLGFFMPVSFLISKIPMDNVLKFVLIYGSFYMCNIVMSVAYINRFRGEEWKKQPIGTKSHG
jgi:putative MATE family efflux protein